MIKTGFSRLCINPPLGTPITGYFEERYTKGILDDLYVSAIAFDDSEKKALLISIDSLMFTKKQCDHMRSVISEYTKVPFDGIFISCSHTHTGPLYDYDHITKTQGDKIYDGFMINQMRDAAMFAIGDLKKSDFSIGEGKADRISFIRRFRMKDGSVMTNPGIDRDDIDHPLGTANETVKLVKIEREGGDDIYIVNFGVHPDTVGGEYISADFPGFVRSTTEAALPGIKCVFLNGAQGDVNHINPFPTAAEKNGTFIDFDGVPRGYEHARHMGMKIAGAVLGICAKTENVVSDKISYNSCTVTIASNAENHKIDEARKICDLHNSGRDSELPYEAMELTTAVAEAARIVDLYNGPESFDFCLSTLKLGQIAFAGLPGEPFTEIGRRIEKSSPFKSTLVCCLTNGGDTYFPTSSAYDEGGYEARSSFLKKGADNILVDGFQKLFEELA